MPSADGSWSLLQDVPDGNTDDAGQRREQGPEKTAVRFFCLPHAWRLVERGTQTRRSAGGGRPTRLRPFRLHEAGIQHRGANSGASRREVTLALEILYD